MDTTFPDEDKTLNITFFIYNLYARVKKLKLRVGVTGWSFTEVRAFGWGYHIILGRLNHLALNLLYDPHSVGHINKPCSNLGVLENLEYIAQFQFSFSRCIFQNSICPINP